MRDGGGAIAGELEQMSANGVEPVMARETVVRVQRLEQVEPGGRAMHHGGGDGVVEQDHGVVRHAFEQIVEGEDLWPVGVLGARCLVMDGGDGSLQCVTADGTSLERAGEQRDALLDGALIPQGTVLFGERDELAGRVRCARCDGHR